MDKQDKNAESYFLVMSYLCQIPAVRRYQGDCGGSGPPPYALQRLHENLPLFQYDEPPAAIFEYIEKASQDQLFSVLAECIDRLLYLILGPSPSNEDDDDE